MTVLNMSYDELCRITVFTMPQTLWVVSVSVTLLFIPRIYLEPFTMSYVKYTPGIYQLNIYIF